MRPKTARFGSSQESPERRRPSNANALCAVVGLQTEFLSELGKQLRKARGIARPVPCSNSTSLDQAEFLFSLVVQRYMWRLRNCHRVIDVFRGGLGNVTGSVSVRPITIIRALLRATHVPALETHVRTDRTILPTPPQNSNAARSSKAPKKTNSHKTNRGASKQHVGLNLIKTFTRPDQPGTFHASDRFR